MVTLKEIYDSVLSTFPGNVREFDSQLIVDWINESYIEIRNQFISNQRFEQFTTTEYVGGFSKHKSIPYLNYTKLKRPVIQDINIDNVVVYAVCRTAPKLSSVEKSWDEGDEAYKNESLYEAVSDVPEMDSSELTFKDCDVRNFYPENGLKYKVGDVVKVDDVFYKCTSEHTNTSEEDISELTEWEQVYWKYKGIGFVDPEIVDFSMVDRKKLVIDGGGVIVTFDKDNLYVSPGILNVEVSYVPEHEHVRNNNGKFSIPGSAVNMWKQLVHQKMLMSRGQAVNDDE